MNPFHKPLLFPASLWLAVGLGLSGCAGLSHKFDADKARDVHKVAIVAVEFQQQRPTDNLGLGSLHQLKDGRDGESPELQQMAARTVAHLADKMHGKTGWQVLSLEQVAANPLYKARVAKVMTGLRTTMPLQAHAEPVYMKGMLDIMAFRRMKPEERAELARSLGVDAVAEVLVYLSIDQSWMSVGHLNGTAAFAFTARTNLQLYGNSSNDPVWRSQNVDGDKTSSSDHLPKEMSKLQRLSKLGEEASDSALDKLVATYPM